jgi:streptogramin lyase
VKLARDARGRIWITDGGGLGSAGGNRLLVFDPTTKQFTSIEMKTRGAKPMGVVAASDGHIWFTQQGANRVSRIRLTGGDHAQHF